MPPKSSIPDAWDDDWEKLADEPETVTAPAGPTPKITRAERKAQHAAANKELWESAETPERNLFLEAKHADIPLKSDFKPAVRVLARKPPPASTSQTPAASSSSPDVGAPPDGDEYSSEEEARRASTARLADRQARAQQERAEKQRKYAEVRSRLFGGGDDGSGGSGTDSATAAASTTRGGRGSGRRGGTRDRDDGRREAGGGASTAGNATLFDPSYTPKPRSTFIQRREGSQGRDETRAKEEEQVLRAPRGPDGSGRGGFGFGARGRGMGRGNG